MTAIQRAGWDSLAQQLPKTDSLGQTYFQTGAQCYIGTNSNRLFMGESPVDDAPGLPSFPSLEEITLVADAGTGSTLNVTWDPDLGTGIQAIIGYSLQRSAGRAFENDYRAVAFTAEDASGSGNNRAAYEARFGTLVAGNRIFARVRLVSSTGIQGPDQTATTIVVST